MSAAAQRGLPGESDGTGGTTGWQTRDQRSGKRMNRKCAQREGVPLVGLGEWEEASDGGVDADGGNRNSDAHAEG